MGTHSHRDTTPGEAIPATDESIERLERALIEVRDALTPFLNRGRTSRIGSRPRPSLAREGLVLMTDDGRGIGRAVAADLKALGHPVLRVRHGVGEGEIEGVNLVSAAAVAALVERARGRGHLSAVVHLSPLRHDQIAMASEWDSPDDSRSLALLAQASGEDLRHAADTGGGCLIVARAERPARDGDLADRLARWVEISSRSLGNVRVRAIDVNLAGEPEVIAAEVVRAVLGTAEPDASRIQTERPTEAILLGAPDRASWIHLAAALADWLDDSPGVDLVDLAHTLHLDQPPFPFRVGLVARSGEDLADRIRRAIAEIAMPNAHTILDPSGAYWYAPSERASRPPRRSKVAPGPWPDRLRFAGRDDTGSVPLREPVGVRALVSRSGRDWLNHVIADRFARGESVQLDSLRFGRPGRVLNLSTPLEFEADPIDGFAETERSERGRPDSRAVEALDAVAALGRDLIEAMANGMIGPA